MKPQESDIGHTAQLDNVRPEETVGLIRTGCFDCLEIRLLRADVLCNLQSMSRESENILQIFRRIFKAHEHIKQISVVSFLEKRPADSGCGGKGNVPFRAESSC